MEIERSPRLMKEVIWVDIKNLHAEGLSISAIARKLGVSRLTVRRYLDADAEKVKQPVKRPSRISKVEPYREYITARLTKFPELSAESLYDELRKHGYEGSTRAVRRYVNRHRVSGSLPPKRTYRRFETLPGEQAQCDWGTVGSIIHHGYRRQLYVFAMVLGYSRTRYVEFRLSQDIFTFMQCHQNAFKYFGGIPREIIYDNAKTVVSSRLGEVVSYNTKFMEYAGHNRFRPRACWAYDPETKGKVERLVGYVQKSFLYGCEYDGLADLNRQSLEWLGTVNSKPHGTTNVPPYDRLGEEQPFLLEIPYPSHEIRHIECRQVGKDQMFKFDGNTYSAPEYYARTKVYVTITDTHLEVKGASSYSMPFNHTRCWGKGQVICRDDHFRNGDPDKAHEMTRRHKRRDAMQARFEDLCESAAEFLKAMAKTGCGNLRDQARKILALSDQYSTDQIEAAMRRCLKYGASDYGTLKRVLQSRLYAFDDSFMETSSGRSFHEIVASLPIVDVEQRDLKEYGGFIQ
jgi:transposase